MKKWITAIVCIIIITAFGLLVYFNIDAIKSNSTLYTKEQMDEAYKTGYNDGLKNEQDYIYQINEFSTKIKELESTIDKLTQYVSENEELKTTIKNLQLQIEQLKATIKYYEELIKNEEDKNIVFVNFYVNEEIVKSVAVKIGGIVPSTEIPEIEETEYLIFNGWEYNGEFVDLNTFTIDNSIDLECNLTYFYLVTFNVNEEIIDTQKIEEGKFARVPDSPQKDGYVFKGWSLNNSIVDVASFLINNDVEFNAIFENTNIIIYKDINNQKYEIKSVDDYFYWKTFNCPVDKSSIVYIEIPSCFNRINLGQFFKNVEQIILPETIKQLDDNCFGECNKLTTITLPKSIETVGRKIFKNCSLLSRIIILNPDLNLQEYPFEGCASILTIEYYGNKQQWNEKEYDNLYDLNDSLNAKKIIIECLDGSIIYE